MLRLPPLCLTAAKSKKRAPTMRTIEDDGRQEAAQAFVDRWLGGVGGQERANYALFLGELVDVLSVPRPDPAGADTEFNDYVLERAVKEPQWDGATRHRRIDLYKRRCFVLEAKQSRLPGKPKEVPGVRTDLFAAVQDKPRRRSDARGWDTLMLNARRQAENYARCLPQDHGWPPFVLVCDVGECIEVYADFSGQGKNYAQFPDRRGFRIFLEDLLQPEIRDRLRRIWTDPRSLDPARESARVTRDIARRLASVSKSLEDRNVDAEDAAGFLMRCLFSMFAEDVGLLPEGGFHDLLRDGEADPARFPPMAGQLWEAMDTGGFAHALKTHVRRFNGQFFKNRAALPLQREELSELRQAAKHSWREVEPAIFGTMLEQALDPDERRRLGAHYTPRAYVERLVNTAVIEALRDDWTLAQATAERHVGAGDKAKAVATVRNFHRKLCETRVLDPACGTGNFLYVTLALMKRLEGEVLEALANLGGQEAFAGLEGHGVDPHQFLGLEVNPRAAAIAELVLWIGHLQWHFNNHGGAPAEPILQAFNNIKVTDAVLAAERRLARDVDGKPLTRRGPDGQEEEVYVYLTPKRPDWPRAEFIVGNPPFIGGKDLRARLGDSYAEALWTAHPDMNDAADFVMYWWDHAALLLTKPKTALRRFGFVTTNSITQVFQRKTLERYLKAKKKPISLLLAVADHPWTKATEKAAAVRIAMTVAAAGKGLEGKALEVTAARALDTDDPIIETAETVGVINPDLTVGVDVTVAVPLKANEGVCSPGVKLHGAGFIVTPQQAEHLGLGRRPGLEKHIRPYRNGKDLTAKSRNVMVIDMFGLSEAEMRKQYPEVWQHLAIKVKPARDKNRRKYRKDNWWLFGENNPEARKSLKKINKFIATSETMKHRIFMFLDGAILPDNKLVAVASDDPYVLGVLSSTIHVVWAMRSGGWLGVGNDPVYVKTRCFDPFPFPDASEGQKQTIRDLAEELDSLRKQRLEQHPHLTLTGLYNVLSRLRAGTPPDALSPEERVILDDGLVLLLKDFHERIDAAVADAYGWPVDLPEEEILSRLIALNRKRAAEEERGKVRWLRPDYQIPLFARQAESEQLEADLGAHAEKEVVPPLPKDDIGQTAAILAVLAEAAEPLDAAAVAAHFRLSRDDKTRVAAVLSALARMGFVRISADGRYAAAK
jgi:hypothetical protein